LTSNEQGGPFAPVVIYMDVWGLREELYDIARKVAVAGYYVVLPDLYYRQGRIRHQWRNERGQMISMHNLEPERQVQVRAPLQKLTDAMVVADSGAILDFWRRVSQFARAASARSGIAWAAASVVTATGRVRCCLALRVGAEHRFPGIQHCCDMTLRWRKPDSNPRSLLADDGAV